MSRDVGADLVGVGPDIVGGGDDRALGPGQLLLDIGRALGLVGVEHVPAFHIDAFAPQLVEAGDAPDIRTDAEILGEQLGRGQDLAQDGPGPEQLDPMGVLFALMDRIHALEDPGLGIFRQRRLNIVLVHRRDVVEDVFLLPIHPAQAVLDDDGELVGIGRVVGDTVRDGRGDHHAVAVLML